MLSQSRRLFVALAVPPEVRTELTAAIEGLPDPLRADGLRWVRPDAWHLTLAFLGAVEPTRADDVAVRLGRAAARAKPFELAITAAGRFGRQVLWAGVAGDRKPLGRLAEATRAAARRAGIEVEDRPYRPHLTLARGNGAVELRPVVDALTALETARWTVGELLLIESHLGAGPGRSSRYDIASRWTFGDRPHTERAGSLRAWTRGPDG